MGAYVCALLLWSLLRVPPLPIHASACMCRHQQCLQVTSLLVPPSLCLHAPAYLPVPTGLPACVHQPACVR